MRIRRIIIGLMAGAVVTLGVSAPAHAAVQIIGGGAATQTYGFMASLQHTDGSHSCGGALIDREWVVTAAHCVTEENTNNTVAPGDFQFRIGSTRYASGGEVVAIDTFVSHPKWDWNGAGYDIALAHLTRPVNAIPVIIGAKPVSGAAVRLIGWGQTCPTRGCGDVPDRLRQLDTTVAPDSACSSGPFSPAEEVCVDSKRGTVGSCYGDSGGPALAKDGARWTLVGITSRGQTEKCADKASIYTSPTAYQDWITDQIR